MPLLSGRVKDAETGECLNNVRVMVARSPGDVIDIAALTWNEGNFELDLPVPGGYTVQFVADGYQSTMVEVLVDEHDRSIDVSMEAGG